MRTNTAIVAVAGALALTGSALAQDLGPRVQKLADGVYVHTGQGFDSNSGIILTQEGVVVIDTGQNPIESRDIMATVKKLTSMPVRLVIDTEPHAASARRCGGGRRRIHAQCRPRRSGSRNAVGRDVPRHESRARRLSVHCAEH